MIEAWLDQEQSCPEITLQGSTTASSDDHGPVRRFVCSRITFPDQVNMAPRFSKVLLTAASPSLALFRLQPPHLALLKNTKRPAPGFRPVFGSLVSHGKPDSAWGRVAFISLRHYAGGPLA
jgi:hypothetical protein